jgi:hypothetical protein
VTLIQKPPKKKPEIAPGPSTMNTKNKLLLPSEYLGNHRPRPRLATLSRYCQASANPQGQPAASSINRLHTNGFSAIPLSKIIGNDCICFSRCDAEVFTIRPHAYYWATRHKSSLPRFRLILPGERLIDVSEAQSCNSFS